MIVHKGFICTTAKHAIGDGRYLSTGDGIIRTEATVSITIGPSILGRSPT